MLNAINIKHVNHTIKKFWPSIEAIYVFGSVASNTETSQSDVDLAVLAHDPPVTDQFLNLKMELANLLRKDVDVVDMRRSDLVTIVQILGNSQMVYCNSQSIVDAFETTSLARYADLNETRKDVIKGIVCRGTVHG